MQLTTPAEAGPWLVEADPEPVSLRDDDVAAAVLACGVCRTDLQLVTGDLPAHKLPIVPGHQVVARIERVGAGVDSSRIGQIVGVAWLAAACGVCRFCFSGRENLCIDAKFTGWDRDGGYASEIVAHADFAIPFPEALVAGENFTPEALAPLMCGGTIGYRSLRIAEISPDSHGKRLGLYGFGASATLVLELAKTWGVDTYVVTRSPSEVQRAIASGATWAGTYDEEPPVLFDAAITFAPAGDVVINALEHVDRGGIVAINAIHLDRIPQFDYDSLWHERSLRSVANVTRDDVCEFLSAVADARITTTYESLPLAEVNDALRRLGEGDVAGSFVVTP